MNSNIDELIDTLAPDKSDVDVVCIEELRTIWKLPNGMFLIKWVSEIYKVEYPYYSIYNPEKNISYAIENKDDMHVDSVIEEINDVLIDNSAQNEIDVFYGFNGRIEIFFDERHPEMREEAYILRGIAKWLLNNGFERLSADEGWMTFYYTNYDAESFTPELDELKSYGIDITRDFFEYLNENHYKPSAYMEGEKAKQLLHLLIDF